MKNNRITAASFLCCVLIAGCDKKSETEIPLPPVEGDEIVPTNYSNADNWMKVDTSRTKNVDVFYFYPTAWSRGEGDPYLADINNASMRADAPKELISQASAFEKAANIFAPWYRQLDVSWMATQLTLEERFPYFRGAPLTDGIAAFEYYLEHWNEGRPFILAGHSQGSEMVRELLITWMKDHPDVYQRMVAAYIIGYSITQDDLSNNKHLKFANSAGDVGVIISYNTEAPEIGGNGKNLTVIDGSIAINPISWTRTGDTAFASQSKGARKYNKETGEYEDKGPLADARVNLERGTVICSTVDVDEYSLKGYEHIFPRGVFHIYDYALYYHDLEENAVLRANNYTKNAINGK